MQYHHYRSGMKSFQLNRSFDSDWFRSPFFDPKRAPRWSSQAASAMPMSPTLGAPDNSRCSGKSSEWWIFHGELYVCLLIVVGKSKIRHGHGSRYLRSGIWLICINWFEDLAFFQRMLFDCMPWNNQRINSCTIMRRTFRFSCFACTLHHLQSISRNVSSATRAFGLASTLEYLRLLDSLRDLGHSTYHLGT